MEAAVDNRASLADRLTGALRDGQFTLFSQSIVPLKSSAMPGAFQEILIRFEEEEQKLLPPGMFLSVLEEDRLMPLLDRWVVGRVAKWIRDSRSAKAQWEAPCSSINLASDTLNDAEFPAYVCKHVEKSKLSKGFLNFEITKDQAIGQLKAVLELVKQLRPIGCQFTISGFQGSIGAYRLLDDLRPDFVKIGQSLLRSIDRAPESIAALLELNHTCRNTGVRTIAEQIESESMLKQIRDAGTDFAQGFAVSHPRRLML
jgi:EAL domain-containing protein (putative c-di-GMP-specific phosphodiesterase class I)